LTEDFDSVDSKKSSKSYLFDAGTNQLIQEQDLMSAEAYRRLYFYDSRRRLQLVSVVIDDTEDVCNQAGICNFSSYNYYDQYSRSKIEQDASGKAVENLYNAKGFLNIVRNKDNTSKEYYKIVTTDARGNITSDRKSSALYSDYSFDVDRGFMTGIASIQTGINNSYAYDALGNITKRSGAGKSECFFYDDLNRLTDGYRFNNATQSCANTTGNIEHNIMQYDGRGNITQKDGHIYSYNTALAGSIGNSPHQVQSKGSQSFVYDGLGNNITTTSFASPNHGLITRNIQYTTFDKVEHIYLGSISNPGEEAFYKYDTSNNRYARVDINATGEKKVTFFIGSTEIQYSNNGQLKHKRQLGNFAIVEETNGISTDRYLFTDHLGSVDKITNATGGLIQSMSFSAWGERRDPTDWDIDITPSTLSSLNQYTNSGFTGHEMVDAFGIINMGGRIYDATLGRMLQSDPFVQDPTNTQSFNRYTYVFNNPLSYTDPSGYFSLRQALGIAVGIVLSVFNPFALNAFWAGFVSGFASTLIITGNLKTALKAGFIAGTVAFVGDKLFPAKGTNPADGTEKATGGNGDVIPEKISNNSRNIPDIQSPEANLHIPTTSTGTALKKVSEFNSSPTTVISEKIIGGESVVELSNATVVYNPITNVYKMPRFFIARSEIIRGFITGGISSLLIQKWASEFANHNINNSFSKLDSFDQNRIDNRVAGELGDIAIEGHKIEVITLENATTARNIALLAISPILLSEAAIALGASVRTFAQNQFNTFARQLNRDILLDSMDLVSNISGGLSREAIIAAERELIILLRRESLEIIIERGIKRDIMNNTLRAMPK